MDLNPSVQSQNINDSVIFNIKNNNYVNVIDDIYNSVNTHLLLLMNQMLSCADEKLIEKANNTKTESEREKFINCTRIFRTESNDISHQFFIKLNNSLSINRGEIESEKDLLVYQEEMDEMVAITTMHSKAMNIYGVEVNHLEARLEYLEIVCDDIFDKDALDPKHICEVFQRTIENIDLAIEAKLIFYKLFDEEVCAKLGVMYKAINQIFIDNDIMPKVVLSSSYNNEAELTEEKVSSRVATYYDPEDNVQTDFIPRTKAEISRVVNQFMAGDMTITGDEIDLPESFLRAPTQQDLDGKDCFERKEVVKALTKLQHKLIALSNGSKPLTTEQIKEELLDDITKKNTEESQKKVNLLDERSIDFVGMMFDAITDDMTISIIVKDLIKRLQVPIMKVAMSDSNLFDNDEHPARAIVNLLTTTGKGINNYSDKLFSKLEAIVDNILNEYDTDIVVFDNAVQVLSNIVRLEKQSTAKTEQLQQKQVFQDHARGIVTTQFKMMARNKKIPNSIRPLLLKNWSTLMLNRYLRHGRDSFQWAQSVSLLRLLLKCIQPIHFNKQHTLVANNHVELAGSVNDELYETQQNKDEISSQIYVLEKLFRTMIDGFSTHTSTESNISDESLTTDDQADEIAFNDIKQQITVARQKLAQLSNTTKPGVWYEIYTGENKAIRRLKLSIILNDTARLIFVDRKGMKVIEKDAEVFAQELKQDKSRILADHSTFDYALGKVMNSFTC